MLQKTYPVQYEMLKKWATETPDKVYLRQPVNRVVKEKTWAQVHDEVLRFAAALQNLGLKKGDRVAILGKNSAEWFISDLAIAAAGLVSTPIYFTAGEETISFIMAHSEAKGIILGKLDDLGPASRAIPEGVITIAQPYDTVPSDHQMEELIATTSPLQDVFEPSLDDTFSIIYTSGSTGNPKGVVLTYRNMGYSATLAVEDLGVLPSDRMISYLPLAHITERAIIEHVSLYKGCTVSFVESLDTFQDDLRDAAPTIFVSVPRLWMKFQSGVLGKMPQKKLDTFLKLPILKNIVKKKIKATLGLTNARLCGSGAAPISPAVLEWFGRLDINITEGYGMSETSGLAVVNYPFQKSKLGTVGRPSKGFEVKFSDEGELLMKGDGIVPGYYNDPEKTAETFKDGWLHTGDKGEMDADGYIRITGRVKEIFKTGKGKYVVPVPIESLMLENSTIEQICVMGSGLPQPVALVVLGEEIVQNMSMDEVKASLAETLKKTNDRLEAHQKMTNVIIAKDQWSIENGLLTPTLKIKRHELEKKYDDLISAPHSETIVMEA